MNIPTHPKLNTAIALVLVAFLLFPVYWMINASLQPGGATLDTSWVPLDPDLSGYRTALSEQGGKHLTSLAVRLGSVSLSLLIAVPAAYALARFRMRWASDLLFALLRSRMVPGIVIALALYGAYADLRLLHSVPGLILADSAAGIPLAVLICRAMMESLPPAIVEAALVDGAGPV